MGRRRRRASNNDDASTTQRRRRRMHRTPKILSSQDLDAIAQRRCLMILSVLSGERGVMEASEEAEISPTQYQQLETKALKAMLAALVPGASESSAAPRVQQLEQRVAELEKAKRRSDRLLWLTRQVIPRGPVKATAGRPRKARRAPSSTTLGKKPSTKPTTPKTMTATTTSRSMPKRDGVGEPSSGIES